MYSTHVDVSADVGVTLARYVQCAKKSFISLRRAPITFRQLSLTKITYTVEDPR
jgi:hypothetical protein